MHSMLYVKAVDKKHIHTFLPITFLTFNQFSIRIFFRKLRLKAFQPYYQILYVMVVSVGDALRWGSSWPPDVILSCRVPLVQV